VDDKECLLDFIIRWGQREAAPGRRRFIPKLLEHIHVKYVSGAFAKDLTVKLFDTEPSVFRRKLVVGDNETKTLRTFVQMQNGDHHYFFEYKLAENGEWYYANAEIVDMYSASKFVLTQDHLFNLRSAAEDKNRTNYSYSFRWAPISDYKNLLKPVYDETHTLRTPRIKTAVHHFQMTAMNTKIYLYLSGANATNFDKYVMYYNSDRNEWKPLVCDYLPVTSESALVSHDSLLYLLGGRPVKNKTHPQKGFAIRYDRRVNKWDRVRDMQHTHECATACSFDGRIYVAGGRNYFGEVINAVEAFDPVAGKWDSVSSLNVKREFCTLVPFNNSLWAIGSRNSLSMEIYDPKNDCWSMYEKSLVRAYGDRIFVNLWEPQYRYSDHDDEVPASVLDTIAF
jgi:hypothetical protein